MKLLALETSSLAGSAAIVQSDRLIGEFYIHVKMTHSQTALPMVEQVLEKTATGLADLDGFAVSIGPGSFTGLRIGIAAVKGLADGLGKPCFGVSTLEGLAYNLLGFEGRICPVLDARCGQIYAALFDGADGQIHRLWPDSAVMLEEHFASIRPDGRPVYLVGDGAAMCFEKLADSCPWLQLAPAALRYQRASSVAFAALCANSPVSAEQLQPAYLRLPQAERELKKKQEKGE